MKFAILDNFHTAAETSYVEFSFIYNDLGQCFTIA